LRRLTGSNLSSAVRDAIRGQVLDSWFRWFIRHDPSPALAHFRGPILALTGSLDRQVLPSQNLAGIRNATVANADVTIIERPGLNHLFQTARTGGLCQEADRCEVSLKSCSRTQNIKAPLPSAAGLSVVWVRSRRRDISARLFHGGGGQCPAPGSGP
ncbi:MAG: hypothetical protein ACRED4_07430, partial [Brevundimonas sp.]